MEIGEEIFAVTHDYPDRSVELHFLACTFLNAPVAAARPGDALGGARRAASLQFPPADDELIALLERDER